MENKLSLSLSVSLSHGFSSTWLTVAYNYMYMLDILLDVSKQATEVIR